MIRAVKKEDLVRLAEIIVFNNRKNYYPIFQDIVYSFKEYNVVSVMNMFENDPIFMSSTYVYEDEVIKGFITVHEGEILKLYVDSFFQNQQIGQKLIDGFPDARHLWALQKNTGAIAFYRRNGFTWDNTTKKEEGTDENLVHLKRTVNRISNKGELYGNQ